jgi:hypothetical protein
MKMYWRTIWKCMVSFMPRPLCPEIRAPSTHWIGGWLGPRSSLDTTVEKRKIPCHCWDSKSGRPAHSLVTILSELSLLLGVRNSFSLQELNADSWPLPQYDSRHCKYKLRNYSLCSLLQSPATSFLLGPNIILSTLFSVTLNIRGYIQKIPD